MGSWFSLEATTPLANPNPQMPPYPRHTGGQAGGRSGGGQLQTTRVMDEAADAGVERGKLWYDSCGTDQNC